MNFKGRRILITGGAGFVGSHLTNYLAGEGARVKVFDSFARGDMTTIKRWGGVEVVNGDITDKELVVKSMKDVDLVVHLAALILNKCVQFPQGAINVNINGTLNVLDGCVENDVGKVVLASSAAVYGPPEFIPVTEEHPTRPINLYGMSKLALEGLARTYHEANGLDYVALRFFNIYGPNQKVDKFYSSAMNTFINKFLENEPPKVFGNGESTMDLVYISDVIDSICIAMDKNSLSRVYNIGSGEETSVNKLLNLIKESLKSDIEPLYMDIRKGDVHPRMCADISKARADLGYEPIVFLEEGLKKVLEWRCNP